MIALDRPGYGASALVRRRRCADPAAPGGARLRRRSTRCSADRPRGAGVFMLAHSSGMRTGAADGGRRARPSTCSAWSWPAPGCASSPAAEEILSQATADVIGLPVCANCLWQPDGALSDRTCSPARRSAPGAAVRGRGDRELVAPRLPGAGRACRGAGPVQRRRARAGLGLDAGGARRHRARCSPRRRGSRSTSMPDSGPQPEPRTGARRSTTRVFCRLSSSASPPDAEEWRRADARRIHRAGQSGRPHGAPHRRGRIPDHAVGPPAGSRSNRSPTPRRRSRLHRPNWPPPVIWCACASSATTTSGTWSTASDGVLAGLRVRWHHRDPQHRASRHLPGTRRNALQPQGVAVIDAPVSGGGPAVEAGHPAGDGRRRRRRSSSRCRPVFATYADPIVHLGAAGQRSGRPRSSTTCCSPPICGGAMSDAGTRRVALGVAPREARRGHQPRLGEQQGAGQHRRVRRQPRQPRADRRCAAAEGRPARREHRRQGRSATRGCGVRCRRRRAEC